MKAEVLHKTHTQSGEILYFSLSLSSSLSASKSAGIHSGWEMF